MFIIILLLQCLNLHTRSFEVSKDTNKLYTDTSWTIIGAGPAGIITIDVLLSLGVKADEICWIDPEFNVGRLGKYYNNVPGNSSIQEVINFLKESYCISRCKEFSQEYFENLEKHEYCNLSFLIEPLKIMTQYLMKKVSCIKSNLKSLDFTGNFWYIETNGITIRSGKVVLATGSKPKKLNYNCNNEIPLDLALDFNNLKKFVNKDDTITVVGSSHSAMLILKYLSELNVKKVINLYNKELKESLLLLKGPVAKWVNEVLKVNLPINFTRLYNNEENREKALKNTTKIIYAIGYERNELPYLKENPNYTYNEKLGYISPGLFGIGIAFPEKDILPETGKIGDKIGITSFLNYAKKVIPVWLKNNDNKCQEDYKIERNRCLYKLSKILNISLL